MRVRASIHTCGAVRVEVIAFAVDVDLVHRPYELAHRTHVFLHLTRQEEAGDADQAWVLALLRNRLERETRKESKYLLFLRKERTYLLPSMVNPRSQQNTTALEWSVRSEVPVPLGFRV